MDNAFPRRRLLSTTEKSVAALLSGMPYVDYDEVEAACAECGRLFRSPEDLDAHRRETHPQVRASTPAKPRTPTLPCSLCSRKFYSIAALKEHTHRDHST